MASRTEKIIAMRKADPSIRAAEIARKIGISRERVRQILASSGLATKIARPALMDRKEYQCWWNMLDRCSNPKNPMFPHYGGRGIAVSQRWLKFENFLEDMGPRPGSGYSIERKNNDGNYTPSNCCWATAKQQANNRRPAVRYPAKKSPR